MATAGSDADNEPAEGRGFTQLVVVGSSAGGIEALSTLVAGLPKDFPAPILVAQHLDPSRESHLNEILTRRSTLPVRTVTDAEHLEPGVVFVVPADRHVEMSDHSVSLSRDHHGRPKPSIDLLFSSAAEIFGDRLIAVILSGTGSDGADGARDVKLAGGTVVVQNPDTAKFSAMPLSLAPSTVDIVANLETLGDLLFDLLTGAHVVGKGPGDPPLQAFLAQLRDRSGIDFGAYKTPTIQRRLQHRMAATGMDGLAPYARYIQRHPEEYQRLVSAFLIKVTEFYRDPEFFGYLRDELMPRLLPEARERGELRLWSAGCATGEEPYSLAMMVSELLGAELADLPVRIFATDIDPDAVDFARRGIYPPAALRSLPPEMVERYFFEFDGAYEVKKQTRSLVVFGQHDLGQRAPFPRIDLTLCRNVLIYFTPELQKRALQLFAFSLRDGGYLALGKAETVTPLAESFALEQSRLKIYRRAGDRVLIPPARFRDVTTPGVGRIAPPRAAVTGSGTTATRFPREVERPRMLGERADGLLTHLPVGVVVVVPRYTIQFINLEARRLLGVHTPAIGEDVLHLVNLVQPAPLRAGLDRGFAGESDTRVIPATLPDDAPDQHRYLEISCSPENRGEHAGPPETARVVVVVRDVTAHVVERENRTREANTVDARAERQIQQIQRLTETGRRMTAANQELTIANAELRSANEELQLGNEEVQAATEEMETLNEELQATNEELETLNEELQATIEELNTTNDDLEARSVELRDLTIALDAQRRITEGERTRLETILGTMSDAVLVVDPDGTLLASNPAYNRLAQPDGSDFVPADELGQPFPAADFPRARATRGDAFSMTFTLPDGDDTRWYEAEGRAALGEGLPRWGVVVIRDITERSLRRLQDRFLAVAGHELRTPLTSLKGNLELLNRTLTQPDADERIRRYAGRALRMVRTLSLQIDDLLDVSRMQQGQLALRREPLDLGPVVENAVETAQALTEQQTIALEAPEEPVRVVGDGARLEQVLLNLLVNAITHAPGSERIEVRLRRQGETAEIRVRDFGPGIPPEALATVFSRFSKVQGGNSRSSGLGLGLYIAREIVMTHGGTIGVESERDGGPAVGSGASIEVRLPLEEEER